MSSSIADQPLKLAVIGGGIAGMAAAVAARRRGAEVTLLERGKRTGGRAGSLRDLRTDQWIDLGQHVTLGCCDHLDRLHRRLHLENAFVPLRNIPFRYFLPREDPPLQSWTLSGCRRVPKFLIPRFGGIDLLPDLLRIPGLTFKERLRVARLTVRLANHPEEMESTFARWLKRHEVPPHVQSRFWEPILLSALSETAPHIAVPVAAKFFRDAFLAGESARTVYLPNASLGTIYGDRAAASLQALGIELKLGVPVRRLEPLAEGGLRLQMEDDAPDATYDAGILAVGHRDARRLLEPHGALFEKPIRWDRFEKGAITAVHLWIDRPLTEQSHVALVGGLSQWMFRPEHLQKIASDEDGTAIGYYHQVLLSASHRLPEIMFESGKNDRNDKILQKVRKELPRWFPEFEKGGVRHARVTTVPDAVFSPTPEVQKERPGPKTLCRHLVLAGDWTDTGWPATMESAARSGEAAVAALMEE
jgi:squalene-associated FAD-dependent desaturase